MRTLISIIFAAAATVCLGAIAISVQSQAQQKMTKERLVGTWKINSLKTTTDNQDSYPLGERPSGYIEFTASRVWLILFDSLRKAPAAASLTDAESVAQMKSHAAWTGKYNVDPAQTPDGIKVTIRVDAASNQAINDTDRIFFIRVDGNKMMLKSPAVVVPMTGKTSVVQVELVKAE